jgi:hypothetical protein
MAEIRGILQRRLMEKRRKPTQKELRELKIQRKELEKEIGLRHELAEQRQEIMKLQRELHPTAQAKLQKFLNTSNKLMAHLGKGMQKLGKMVQESEKSKKVKIIKR